MICVRVAHGQTSCREASADPTYWCLACRTPTKTDGCPPGGRSKTQAETRRGEACACTAPIPLRAPVPLPHCGAP